MGVFKALGELIYGASKTTAEIGIGAVVMGAKGSYKLGSTVFTQRSGKVVDHLTSGQFIPFRLKHGLGVAAIGGMAAYSGLEAISPQHKMKQIMNNPNVPYVDIPGTIGKSAPVDNMNADGDIVMALHNNQRR